MPQVDAQLASILKAIQDAVVKFAPEAARVLLLTYRIQAAQWLVVGLCSLILGTVGYFWLGKIIAKGLATCKENDGDDSNWYFAKLMLTAGWMVSVVIWGLAWLNPWTWVAIYQPQVYLAHLILIKAGVQ